MITKFLRFLTYYLFLKPFVYVILGINFCNRDRFPVKGPAIIVANHNSHLDTLVLMTLFPWAILDKVRPVAAEDYFSKNKLIKWLSDNIVGVIQISRVKTGQDRHQVLQPVCDALQNDSIVIIFPEGTRGEPEKMVKLKNGVATLSEKFPKVPVTPIFTYGLGKSLPKGKKILIPFQCQIRVGKPIFWLGDSDKFMKEIESSFESLSNKETD